MALEAQAALETAVVNAIRAAALGGFTWTTKNSGRMYNGEPPPACGNYWLSVWSDNNRSSKWRTALEEKFEVYVTLTVRAVQPWDRMVVHRDDLEAKLNRISALIHQDVWTYAISRAANTLAAYDGVSQVVGFREGLKFLRYDPIQEVGAAWFKSQLDDPRTGLAQTARFGDCLHVRAVATAD